VQLYTGLVYEGPTLARTITRGMAAALDAEGASAIDALVRTLSPSHDEAAGRERAATP
jgi:dihydroorotate dehydrogenase